MNVMSAVVGTAIMGATAPMIAQMSIAPYQANKRAENFGIAETAAVVFVATYEGGTDLPKNTDACIAAEREGVKNAYSVTCTHGVDQYVQSVTRAFRLAVPDSGSDSGAGAASGRTFAYETPTRFSGHQCPTYDEWGVNGYNDLYYKALNGACIPKPLWTQTLYQLSDPSAWKYDVNNYNGWGFHPDY